MTRIVDVGRHGGQIGEAGETLEENLKIKKKEEGRKKKKREKRKKKEERKKKEKEERKRKKKDWKGTPL